MDPWFFNKNNNQNRWETLEPEFNSFFESNASSSIKWEEYQQLLSPSYFQSSLKILKERVGDSGGIMIQPLNNKDKLGDRIARLNDGTIYYDKKYRSASLSEIKERITTFISGDVYSLEDYENLSERDMQRFKILIEDILANDIELIFLMIPYPPRVYEYLVKDDRYRIIEQFEGWVREYAFEQGIPLTGSLNPLKFELKTDHFYDGMHLNEDGLAVLLEDKVF